MEGHSGSTDRIKQLKPAECCCDGRRTQDRTAKILQEQEKDLLRAFRARLFDIQVRAGAGQDRQAGRQAYRIVRCDHPCAPAVCV